jgi:protein TonB
VAYRSDINPRDRGGAITAVVAIHALLLFMLLHLSGKIDLGDPQSALRIIDLRLVKPPPPPPPASRREQARPKEKEGGSAPKNIRSQATPVVAPKPKVVTPPVQQIVASETPRQGPSPTQGASDVRGPGTGAGGQGNGTGSGSGGNGPGGGGEMAEPPRLATPVLYGRDFPPEMLEQWPGRATVFMRLRVDPRGYVSECTVDRGTGIRSIDDRLCNLAHDRLRFRPALNRNGQAVAGWFGYAQPAPL